MLATAVLEAYKGPSTVREYRIKMTRKLFCSTSAASAWFLMLNRSVAFIFVTSFTALYAITA